MRCKCDQVFKFNFSVVFDISKVKVKESFSVYAARIGGGRKE